MFSSVEPLVCHAFSPEEFLYLSHVLLPWEDGIPTGSLCLNGWLEDAKLERGEGRGKREPAFRNSQQKKKSKNSQVQGWAGRVVVMHHM
jgi:hypothetical protein